MSLTLTMIKHLYIYTGFDLPNKMIELIEDLAYYLSTLEYKSGTYGGHQA